MFDRSKLESLRDVSVTRIGDIFLRFSADCLFERDWNVCELKLLFFNSCIYTRKLATSLKVSVVLKF